LSQTDGSHDASDFMNKLITILPEDIDEANAILDAILNLDWDATNSVRTFSDTIVDLGLKTDGTTGDLINLENSLITLSGAINKVDF
jgi:hypothetical protein